MRVHPKRVLPAHLADQLADVARNDRSSRLAVPHLPGPEQPKAGTMPGKDRFGFDDGSAERQSCQRRDKDPQPGSAEVNFRRFAADP
jgi:hypothetical protein